MVNVRRLGLSFLLVVSILVPPQSALGSSTVVDEQLYELPMPTQEAGWLGAFVDDSVSFRFSSFIIGSDSETIKNGLGFPCFDLKSTDCLKHERITYNVFLPPCSDVISTDCIVEFTAIKKDGSKLSGKYKAVKPNLPDPTFKGDKTKKIPDGWFPSVWSFDGVTHDGGTDFLLRASLFGFQQPINAPQSQMRVGVNAVSFASSPDSGVWTQETVREIVSRNSSGGLLGAGGASGPSCEFFLAVRECASAWALPKDLRFKVVIRTTSKSSGWINGRLLDPQIELISGVDGSYTYTIEAAPMQVPVYGAWARFSSLSKEFQDYIQKQGGKAGRITFPTDWRSLYSGSGAEPFDKISSYHALNNYNQDDFDEFLLFLKETSDKSVATKSLWHLETNQNYNQVGSLKLRDCTRSATGIAGVVTTNSTMFLATPPEFDEKSQSLDYKVSAPHLDKAGNKNVGAYNLLIDSQVARCLYKFSSAPISASVSVVNANGTEQIATYVVKEGNGWLTLATSGYTYSAPTIRVRLSQEAAPEVAKPGSSSKDESAVVSVLPPIIVDPKLAKRVSVRVSDVVVFNVERPTSWKAKVGNKSVVAFVKGKKEATYVTNPGLTPLKVGKTFVTLTNGKSTFKIAVTITP